MFRQPRPHSLLITLGLGLCLAVPALALQQGDRSSGLPSRVRMPAEFEPKDALLVGCAQMVQFHPQALVDIVGAIFDHIQVVGLVGFEEEKRQVATLLADAGVDTAAVTTVLAPVMTMWARDYGPLTVLDRHGRPYFLNATYRGRGAALDDAVPEHLAAELEIPVFDLPLTMEGGDLLTNGLGLVVSTQRLLLRNQEERGYDLEHVWHILQRYFGFTDWVPLPSLQGEPTGHLDMFMTFVAPRIAVVGRYDPGQDDTNAPWLDWVARQLNGRATPEGPLRVERIPMPPNGDGVWRTYTNVVFANDVLLVPTYPTVCPELDADAIATYERLLPDWKVVGVDASSLIGRKGALHCVTMGLPAVPSLM